MIEIGIIKDTPVNKIIDIRDKNQFIKAKYAIDKGDILKYTLMAEHYIEISFELNRNGTFKRSDYIEWEGEKYTLREDYQPEQINKRKYKYTLKFEAVEMFFQDIQYYYLNLGLKESEWKLTGNPEYFIKIAVDNINRYFGTTDFKVGTIEPTEIKDITFEVNTNTFNALTQIADEYGAEWYITGKTIHLLTKVSFGDEVDFESEVSVLSMKREEGESTTRYTRILALGSTRNIPYNYRETTPNEAVDAIYQKRLRIPASKGDVIDAYPNMSPDEVVEGTVIFDKVYPKRVGTIEAVGTIENQDVNEDTGEVTKWNAYKFKDPGINFKEEYKLPEQELKLQFTSGDLNGRDFALKFHPKGFSSSDNSQFFEIYRTDEFGKLLPNDVMKPKAGDKYVLYGFNIALVSDQYVPAGELELYNEATAWQQKQLRDTGVYECPTVIKHFKDNQLDLAIGQKVRLIKDVGSSRNLIRNSELLYTLASGWGGGFLKMSNKGDYLRFDSLGNRAEAHAYFLDNLSGTNTTQPLEIGQEYILSVDIRTNAKQYRAGFRKNPATQMFYDIKDTPVKDTWFRHTQRIVIDGTAWTGLLWLVGINDVVSTEFYVEVKNWKLEKGNKATPWTLAPEDVSDAIRSSRIMGFEKKLNNKFDAIYTVGDNSTYSRFGNIEQQIKELQVAGVVYESTGGGGVYVIKQNDSTRPTDFNVYSAQASDAKYFNKKLGGAIEGETLFIKDVQHQGKVISDVFQNSTFTAGQLGSGFQIKKDVNGQSYVEVDNILVRREAVFNRLTIAEIKSIGGTILLSLASMVLSKVEVKASTWKCFFDTADDTIPNDFAVGDQAICRKFTGKNIKYYWALVTAVGADYIELSKTDKDGSGIPSFGDEVVQLGNRTDVNRQYAIMLSAYGSSAPSIYQYAGINSYDLTGKEVTAISPKGNKLTGSFIVSTNGTTAPVYKERGGFVNGTVYYLDDRVSYLGAYWVCNVNTTITTPSESSSTWQKDTVGQTDINNATNQVRTEYKADFVVLDTKIASKVSQTDFSALGQRVSKSESDIIQQADRIQLTVEKINTLQVDNVNLMKNSKTKPNGVNAGGSAIQNEDGSFTVNAISSFYWTQYIPIEVGRYYSISIRCKKLSSTAYGLYWYLDAENQYLLIPGTENITDEYVTYTGTRLINSVSGSGYFHLSCINTNLQIEWIKIVAGEKPSLTWSAAPEDTDKAIKDAKNNATQAQTDASNAQIAANKAQTDANSANNLLTDIASDNKLTPNEKQETKMEWDAIVSEYPKNIAQANKFSVSTTAYTNAYNALNSYITPLLSNLGTTSDINGTTFRATFKAYYDARTDLLNAISTKAKELADTAQTSANNAQNTADSKNRTHYQDAVPTAPSGGHKVGDLWYKIALVDSSGNVNADTSKNIYQLQYRWDGTTWLQINWSVSKSKIEQTDSSISLIVEKTGINSVGAGETLKSLIDQTPDKITLAVSAIQIGGVNKFRNTNFLSSANRSFTPPSIAWLNENRGEQMALSLYINTENAVLSGNKRIGAEFFVTFSDGTISYFGVWMTFPDTATTYKGRISRTFTFPDKQVVSIGHCQTFFQTFVSGTANAGYPKLEEGNKATSWTEAPEDTQSQIDGKTTLAEVASSLTMTDNKIILASKTIELKGTTIAKAIEAEDLKVGSRAGLSALEVLKNGTFYAKGSTSNNSSLIIDSGTQSITITSPKSTSGEGNNISGSSNVTISGESGGVRVDGSTAISSNSATIVSNSGIFANTAGQGIFPAATGISARASIVGLGWGNVTKDTYADRNFVAGVYGSASNSGSAPAFGGYFDLLRANGLYIAIRRISIGTTLNKYDCYVSCYNTSDITVYLPSSPYTGQVIYIRQMNANGIMINGNGISIHTNGDTVVWIWNRAGRGDTTMLIYDGQYWNLNYMPR